MLANQYTPPQASFSHLKLDRLIARLTSTGRSEAHRLIAARRVLVDSVIVTNNQHETDRFMRVELDGNVIRPAARMLHIMLHKPVGILSATTDQQHRTVIDLIDDPDRHTLHIAGRLDRATSGLVLLTNDGRWSKRITDAESKVAKVYVVETESDIDPSAVEAFANGFYFHPEQATTLPAKLEILGERQARVTLHEGRHHQIKRMFFRVNNRVVTLHRESIGPLTLGDDLPSGQWRTLTAEEVMMF